MSTKAKIASAGVAVVLVVALAIIFIWSGNNIEEPSTIDANKILSIGKTEEISMTPISDGVVSEQLQDEPILSGSDGFWTENRTPTTTYEQELYIPDDVDIAVYDDDPLLTGSLEGYNFAEHYGYIWTNKVFYHPVAGTMMGYYQQLPFYFNEDPNEKKEQLIYIVDSFRSEFDNVLYQNNTEITNIYDIPSDGLYILASTDTAWMSLRITSPTTVNGVNSFYVYLTAVTKRYQIVKNVSQLFDAEIERIQNICDYLGIEYVWDTIVRVGTQYIPDASQVQPKEPEDYTTEDEMLLQALGIF